MVLHNESDEESIDDWSVVQEASDQGPTEPRHVFTDAQISDMAAGRYLKEQHMLRQRRQEVESEQITSLHRALATRAQCQWCACPVARCVSPYLPAKI